MFIRLSKNVNVVQNPILKYIKMNAIISYKIIQNFYVNGVINNDLIMFKLNNPLSR